MAGLDRSKAEQDLQWDLVNTPLGGERSGFIRYAAAMYFYQIGELSAEALEIYRLSTQLDHQDSVPIIFETGADPAWAARFSNETS